MPIVPGMPDAQGPTNPMAQPSPTNLLMAAAEMKGQGKLTEEPRSIPKGQQVPKLHTNARPQRNRPLKVIK